MSWRPWTTSELAFLRASAGRLATGEIAEALSRTPKAVAQMAQRERLSLAVPRLVWCPSCATLRSSLARSGVCAACELAASARRSRHAAVARLAEVQATASEAAAVDAAQRRLGSARQKARRGKTGS